MLSKALEFYLMSNRTLSHLMDECLDDLKPKVNLALANNIAQSVEVK